MSDKRILITGGAGYIGSVLSENILDRGYDVTVFDNLSFGAESLMHLAHRPNFHFQFGDVRDNRQMKEMVPKFDILIPLAAIVGYPQCEKNSVDARLTNRDAVIELNRLRSREQMLLFPNTNSGYGTTTGEIHCTEESPLNPISTYGSTKCDAERALFESGKPIVAFRLATAFGLSPRMRTDLLLNYFVFKAVTDNFLAVYQKESKRNFIHVRDISDCFAFAIENFDKMDGNAYNLGIDSANVSKKELVDIIKSYVPSQIEKFDVSFTENGEDVDKRNYIVSNEKLRKAGFEAKYGLDYGIPELIRGYKLMFANTVFRQ